MSDVTKYPKWQLEWAKFTDDSVKRIKAVQDIASVPAGGSATGGQGDAQAVTRDITDPSFSTSRVRRSKQRSASASPSSSGPYSGTPRRRGSPTMRYAAPFGGQCDAQAASGQPLSSASSTAEDVLFAERGRRGLSSQNDKEAIEATPSTARMRPGGTLAARFSTARGASSDREASSLGFPTGSLPQGGSGPFGNQSTSTGRMPPNGTLAAQLCDQSRLPFAVERDLTPSSMASTGQGDAQAGASLADRYAPARASSRTRNALLPHPAVAGPIATTPLAGPSTSQIAVDNASYQMAEGMMELELPGDLAIPTTISPNNAGNISTEYNVDWTMRYHGGGGPPGGGRGPPGGGGGPPGGGSNAIDTDTDSDADVVMFTLGGLTQVNVQANLHIQQKQENHLHIGAGDDAVIAAKQLADRRVAEIKQTSAILLEQNALIGITLPRNEDKDFLNRHLIAPSSLIICTLRSSVSITFKLTPALSPFNKFKQDFFEALNTLSWRSR